MKKTMQTLMLTVGAVVLASGAVMAAGGTDTRANANPAMQTQAGMSAETTASTRRR